MAQKIGDRKVASCRMTGIEAGMSRYRALSGPSQSPSAKVLIAASNIASGIVTKQIGLGDVPNMKANGINTIAL